MAEEVMARTKAATVVVMEGLVEVKPVTRAEVCSLIINDFCAWLTSRRLWPHEQGLHTGPEMLQLYEILKPQIEWFTLTEVGGEVGHLSRDCPSEASSERTCYKCKQPGHIQSACPA